LPHPRGQVHIDPSELLIGGSIVETLDKTARTILGLIEPEGEKLNEAQQDTKKAFVRPGIKAVATELKTRIKAGLGISGD
jgi:hypothetical protein